MSADRDHWLDQVEEVATLRHYSRLTEGLGSEPVDEALSCLVADIMHVCRRCGMAWSDVLVRGCLRYVREQADRRIQETRSTSS